MITATVTYRPNPGGVHHLLGDPNGPYGQWLLRVGNQMVNAAKRRANVDTGNMRSTIAFTVEVEAGRVVGVLAARTNYAIFVHQGTRHYRGNPFLTDAVRETLT